MVNYAACFPALSFLFASLNGTRVRHPQKVVANSFSGRMSPLVDVAVLVSYYRILSIVYKAVYIIPLQITPCGSFRRDSLPAKSR